MSDDLREGTRLALLAAARKYYIALGVASVVGLVVLVALALTGHFAAGLLFCVGLALGVVNSQFVQRSLAGSVSAPETDRRAITFSMLKRLVVISAIAFAIGILYQPDGWFVFVGLATFQMLVMGAVFSGLLREVRRS